MGLIAASGCYLKTKWLDITRHYSNYLQLVWILVDNMVETLLITKTKIKTTT